VGGDGDRHTVTAGCDDKILPHVRAHFLGFFGWAHIRASQQDAWFPHRDVFEVHYESILLNINFWWR